MTEFSQVDVNDFLETSVQKLNIYLATVFAQNSEPQKLFDAMRYSLLAPGKRLRPALCLAVAQTLGVAEDDVISVAAALELVHAYSLIHDDLPAMDNDDLRRGQPTNHNVFGEATALLAGDGLLTHAFTLLSQPRSFLHPEQQLELVLCLAVAAGPYGMVGGQQADLAAETQRPDISMLRFIHTHKTAALIEAAVVMGAIVGGATSEQRTLLASYGRHLGLAFQIVDDLLDVTATTQELGKSAGADERQHKMTYPAAVGVAETRKMADDELAQALTSLTGVGLHTSLLVGLAKMSVRRIH
ncbi:polyprenyl synthetase family protein [Alicyclobacillaceae bacterium I2511]|nr:polyprenyl synthetase family protein [Alicyclobacillaceae bacterium I2511]